MNTAVAYLRVSGKDQISGGGFDRQIASCQWHAEVHGYNIASVYEEKAVSGKIGEESRPAFQTMVSEVLSQDPKPVVIVEALHRLAREYRIQEQLLIYLASKGISLIAADTGENITDAVIGDPMRRAMVQIQGVFAELDKNLNVDRLRKGRERKKSLAGRAEGRIPYGQHPQFPEEKDRLFAFRSLREGGLSLKEIARYANQENWSTRLPGKAWHPGTIQKILSRSQQEQTI